MRTIDRNYRKNPHTASFLQVFHTGIGTNGRDYRAEMADDAEALAQEAAQNDLLDLVDDTEIEDARTPGQVKFMADLIARLTKLDTETGRQAREFTDKVTGKGGWTSGRGGNASEWIDRMLTKERDLTARKAPAAPKGTVEIPAGTYAVETDEIRCYTIDYGKEGTRWAGFLFLNRISSDDRFPVKNPAAKAEILAAIGADVEASSILAALTLRICRGTMKNGRPCGRTLSDTKNPYFNLGLGPECGKN